MAKVSLRRRIAVGASRGVGKLADLRLPRPVVASAVRLYAWGLRVDRGEAEVPPGGYKSFGDFFARRLQVGARPIAAEDGAVVSPCDGRLVAVQDLVSTPDAARLEVKGYAYDVDALLADPGAHARFSGGGGAVIYLHPRDYHRVHAPCDGALVRVRHVAGARFPVADWFERWVEGVFVRNERMIFDMEVDGGWMAVVMVAAFGVGYLDSPFAPPTGRHVAATRVFDPPRALGAGDELGAFRLGSTVVLLWSEGVLEDVTHPVGAPIRFGSRLGTLGARSQGDV